MWPMTIALLGSGHPRLSVGPLCDQYISLYYQEMKQLGIRLRTICYQLPGHMIIKMGWLGVEGLERPPTNCSHCFFFPLSGTPFSLSLPKGFFWVPGSMKSHRGFVTSVHGLSHMSQRGELMMIILVVHRKQ